MSKCLDDELYDIYIEDGKQIIESLREIYNKGRADAIDECLEIIRNNYRTDAIEELEQLKEKNMYIDEQLLKLEAEEFLSSNSKLYRYIYNQALEDAERKLIMDKDYTPYLSIIIVLLACIATRLFFI